MPGRDRSKEGLRRTQKVVTEVTPDDALTPEYYNFSHP